MVLTVQLKRFPLLNRIKLYKDELLIRKERRNYRKRRHKNSTTRGGLTAIGVPTPTASTVSASVASSVRGMSCFSDGPSASSEDEAESAVVASQSEADEAESDIEKQGPFTFRRKLHCNYLAVSSQRFVGSERRRALAEKLLIVSYKLFLFLSSKKRKNFYRLYCSRPRCQVHILTMVPMMVG